MKQHLIRSFAAMVLCAVAAVTAFADKVKKAELTLADDVMVSGTLVKAGTYEFRFNQDTGELSILKDGEVKAKTAVRLEERSDKSKYTAIRSRKNAGVNEMTGLVFGGWKQEVVVTTPSARR